MEIYDQVLRIIDANIIYGLPGIVITLFVAKQIAGKKIKTSLILNAEKKYALIMNILNKNLDNEFEKKFTIIM